MKKVFIIILGLMFLTYIPHITYHLPYHLDEWDHIGRALRIQDQGLSYFLHNTPIEVGFDVWLLIIIKIISIFGIGIVNFYQFLPAINAGVIGLILYYYMKRQYNESLALLAALLVISLPSNSNILGLWFYVPVIAGIILDYIILFNLEETKHNTTKIFIVISALLLLALVHQSSFLLMSLICIIFIIRNKMYKNISKNKLLAISSLLIPCIIMFFTLSDKGKNLSKFLTSFIWGPITPQINYNIITLWGIMPCLLAIYGFYLCFKSKKLLAFRIYFTVSLVSILIFPLIQFSVFSAYQRYVYHLMIAGIPLAAVGFQEFLSKIDKINIKEILKKAIKIIIIVLFCLITIWNSYNIDSNAKLYHSIEPYEVNILKLTQEYNSTLIMTPIEKGISVRPLTEKHDEVVNFFDWRSSSDIDKFYSGSCAVKEEYLYNHYLITDDLNGVLRIPESETQSINLVISPSRQNCPFLKEISEENGTFLYEFMHEDSILFKISRNLENNENIKSRNILYNSDNISVSIRIDYSQNASNRATILKYAYGDGTYTSWKLDIENDSILFRMGNGTNTFVLKSKDKLKDGINNILIDIKDRKPIVYLNNKVAISSNEQIKYEFVNIPWKDQFLLGDYSPDFQEVRQINEVIVKRT